MTFPASPQIQTQTVAGSLASGLKAKSGLSGLSDSLFAGLLSETAKGSAAREKSEAAPAPLSAPRDDAFAKMQDPSGQPAAQDKAARRSEGKAASSAAGSKSEARSAQEDQEASAAQEERDAASEIETQETREPDQEVVKEPGAEDGAAAARAAQDKDEKKTEETDDEDENPYLAALIPFGEEASAVVALNGAQPPMNAARTASADAQTDAAQEAGQTLQDPALQAQALEAGQTEGDGKKRTPRHAIAEALQTRADHRQSQFAQESAALSAQEAGGQEAVEDLASSDPFFKKDEGAFLANQSQEKTQAKTNAQQMAATSEAAALQPQSQRVTDATPLVAGQGAAAALKAASAQAQTSESALGAVSTQASGSAPNAGSAAALVRPLSGYDFASQLSSNLVATKAGGASAPQIVEQVAVQINKMAKEGQSEITINLKPAELGKIEVRLEIRADKTVQGTVIADQASTLNLLSKDAGSLQRALLDAGLQADMGSLSFSLRGEGQNSFAQNRPESSGAGINLAKLSEGGEEQEIVSSQALYEGQLWAGAGRVNLRV